jgi:hypothetical protein
MFEYCGVQKFQVLARNNNMYLRSFMVSEQRRKNLNTTMKMAGQKKATTR